MMTVLNMINRLAFVLRRKSRAPTLQDHTGCSAWNKFNAKAAAKSHHDKHFQDTCYRND